MKKLLSILAVLTLILTLSACKASTDTQSKPSDYADSANTDAVKVTKDDYLIEVLKGEHTFFDENGNEVYLKDYQTPLFDQRYMFEAKDYTLVDLDINGQNELVSLDKGQNIFIILRYNTIDQKVYGYSLNVRSMTSLKTDGSFMASESADKNSICRITFTDNELKLVTLTVYDWQNYIYQKDGIDVDRPTLDAFYTEWDKLPNAEWIAI